VVRFVDDHKPERTGSEGSGAPLGTAERRDAADDDPRAGVVALGLG